LNDFSKCLFELIARVFNHCSSAPFQYRTVFTRHEPKEYALPHIIDAPVDVELSADGDPRAFIWNRFEHTVIGQPQAVFKRTRWWEDQGTPTRIDTELWRLDASRGDEEQHRYDLRRGTDGSWVLALDWG
jgi:hypothetical protein